MKVKSSLKYVLALGLALQFNANAYISTYDKMNESHIFYSLNSDIDTKGPIYKGDKSEYLDEVFKLYLDVAHDVYEKRGKQYNNKKFYYTYLVAALTVIHKESALMHFRNLEDSVCLDKLNKGEKMKKVHNDLYEEFFLPFFKPQTLTDDFKDLYETYTGDEKHKRGTTYKTLVESFLNDNSVDIFPNCSEFKDKKDITQIISSYDYYSTGLMQVHFKAHYSEYTYKKLYLDLSKTMAYGLNYLFDGLEELYFNYNRSKTFEKVNNDGTKEVVTKKFYDCLTEDKHKNNKVSLKAVVRGAWGGKYNSGTLLGYKWKDSKGKWREWYEKDGAKSMGCRFDNEDHAWHGNDVSFNKDLTMILAKSKRMKFDDNSSRYNFYENHLNEKNQKVFHKIIDNFNKVENEGSLDVPSSIYKTASVISTPNLGECSTEEDYSENYYFQEDSYYQDYPVCDQDEYIAPVKDEHTYNVFLVNVRSSLNARSAPEQKNNICGSLKNDQKVYATGVTKGNWIEIEPSKTDGLNRCSDKAYVHKSYLK